MGFLNLAMAPEPRVMAVRYNQCRDEWVAYTTMRWRKSCCNEKRICRLTNWKEIAVLAEEVMRWSCPEEWMAKEKLKGENFMTCVLSVGR